MPEARIKNLPEDIDKALRVHMARYDFKIKGDAIVDVLKRFFSDEDYDYFLKENENMQVNKQDPDYVKKMDSNKKKKVKKK